MKVKWLICNIVGLVAAIAVFSGTFIYAATNVQQVSAVVSSNTPPLAQNKPQDDDFYQNDIGIGDLLFQTSSEQESSSDESSEVTSSVSSSSEQTSSKASSTVTSSKLQKPVSSVPSSKPASSTPPSSTPSSEVISSEESSSEETSSEETPSDNDIVDEELLQILSGAVQREMVGTNTTPNPAYYEAYKAQAVACHSYMEYHKKQTGSYPTMSYSTPHAKTVALVREVMNELMYYNGSVVNASYHAAAGGYTQAASYVWGNNVGYLQAVPSAYDEYESSYSISADTLQSKLANVGISVSDDPSTWFDLDNASRTDGDFVNTISVGDGSITGRKLRESVLGSTNLKSCKITAIQADSSTVTFYTRGYGHGVGMSQLGALGYAANEGWSHTQILTHYYFGVTIE